ncbi:hypothetical protein CYLTODRAFT_442039 [Cylindrobasidium torrendii FP15055 ss-10]|uniref:Uncharacterized protein n=1 Tax=Cylindrobasidium torrendii FP15055 ss-10 TaxID=1314674 RepID=A0A0D7BIT1_9AGAR|nr:hypothetical protein CYLTODRAFT_442039 [Cylindrobasidium torrendii FP15055 ss-10]
MSKPSSSNADAPPRLNPFENLIPPAGVTIEPFSSYKEVTLALKTDDGVERDLLNIPSIDLHKVHSTDKPKTNLHLNQVVAKPLPSYKGKGGHPEDYHLAWRLQEFRIKPGGYDPRLSDEERVRQATKDFTDHRPWPDTQNMSKNNIRNIWTYVQTLIGVLASLPPKKKKARKTEDNAQSDDEAPQPEAEKTELEAAADDERQRAEIQAQMHAKLQAFCEEPLKWVRMFLSHFIMEQGLALSSDTLPAETARVFAFYTRYLRDNDVFVGRRREVDDMVRCAELACEEIDFLPKLDRLRGDLDELLLKTFGLSPDTFWAADIKFDPEEDSRHDAYEAELEEQGAEIVKTQDLDGPVSDTSSLIDQESLGGSGVTDLVDKTEDITQWVGASAEANWGLDSDNGDAEAEAPITLLSLLGPTALPITHTSGILEDSAREIVKIIPPVQKPPKSAVATEPSADAVEGELEAKFHRVVLRPWNEFVSPSTHRLSRGQAIPLEDEMPTAYDGPRPHHLGHDDITILTNKDTADLLEKCRGMRVHAVFVQLARCSDFEQVEEGTKKKKSKRGDARLWFVSHVKGSFPSYHTEFL